MAKEGNVAKGIAECSDRSYLWSVSAMAHSPLRSWWNLESKEKLDW